MKVKILFFILFINSVQFCYSQISIGKIEKKIDILVLKPEPYDSLKNLTWQKSNIDYKQYIGLQFYLPPFSNPQIGSSPRYNKTKLFLFSTKPNVLIIDSTQNILRFRETWSQTSARKSGNKTIEYDKIYTYAYNPFHYYSSKDSYARVKVNISNNESVSNRYFTLLGVLYEDELNALLQKMKSELSNKDTKIFEIIKQYRKDLFGNFESTIWENVTIQL